MRKNRFTGDILILGDGLLGQTVRDITGWDIASRKGDGIDITKPHTYKRFLGYYDHFLNCMAYTETYSEDRDKHWGTNYVAVIDLVDHLNKGNKRLIHISTDYVYSNSKPFASENDPPSNAANWYSYTKMLGDAYVQAKCNNWLLIRTSFKPNPFPYEKALTSQTGNFDYVDVIAKKIISLITMGASGLFNVGTQMKTVYDLAVKTSPDVAPMDEKVHETMPTDITMNISKMASFLEEK